MGEGCGDIDLSVEVDRVMTLPGSWSKRVLFKIRGWLEKKKEKIANFWQGTLINKFNTM